MGDKILEVKNLKTKYITRFREDVYAVDDVSLSIEEGKSLGIAGESGCGKSTLALSLMGYYFPPLHYISGDIIINGKNISEMDPDYVGALSLIVVPGTPIAEDLRTGKLVLPTPFELIRELGTMIANCHFTKCFFASNHASNYLPLRVRMPGDKERALRLIRDVLQRKDPELLRPEYMRAL
jgi:ABC-type dipeptide/oligopeptide/nickel transport system ATPase component